MIVGLGNPGSKYEGTRHNFGFAVVDLLGKRWSIDLGREKFHAWFGEGSIRDHRVMLLKPTTFMNRSGQAVAAAGRFYQLEPADLLAISDDLSLPLGKLRIRPGGSAGGHKGLTDIIARVGSEDFARLRIGIDHPGGDPVSYVLQRFTPQEQPVADEAVRRAADAVESWLKGDIERTMNEFN